MMKFPTCSMGAFNKNTVDQPNFPSLKMVCFVFYMMGSCVSDSEYRPLLPYTESTSQILLTSLNPVDSRKWRRKPWSWRVVKVLKVCRIPDSGGV